MTGKIRSILHEKKFGFIQGEDKRDYFFHQQDLVNQAQYFDHIEEGMKVSFEPGETVKGLRARNVDLI